MSDFRETISHCQPDHWDKKLVTIWGQYDRQGTNRIFGKTTAEGQHQRKWCTSSELNMHWGTVRLEDNFRLALGLWKSQKLKHSSHLLQSKKGWVLRNTAIFSVKFTGDANEWIMTQPKGESDTAKELSFAKRFPCQSIKTFHKKKKNHQPLTQHQTGSEL